MYVRAADPALAPRVAELVAQRLAATPPRTPCFILRFPLFINIQ